MVWLALLIGQSVGNGLSELLLATGNHLKSLGYEIRVLNLVNLSQSNGYNPFRYIRDEKDALKLVNNLNQAIGLILLGFGILQIGLALKSHDASQRANGMLTVAGGIVITFTKEILTMITGG